MSRADVRELDTHYCRPIDQLPLQRGVRVGVPRLQALCESVISQRLTPRRFVAQYASLRYGRDPMLRLCYYWFKIKGATDFDVVQLRASMTATERAVDSVVSADALPRSSLYLHATGDQGIEVLLAARTVPIGSACERVAG